MRSRRTRAAARRVALRQRAAPDALVSGGSIRVAATTRPTATRAALLGGAWLGALAMLAPDAAQAQQGPFVYVPNNGDVPGSVSVIDTPTNTVAPTAIPVGLSPVAAAVRGDESLVYVTNQGGSNTVSVINTATNTVVATIPVGIVPQLLAVTPDGTRVYVPNQGSDTVSVINTATNTVVATIAAGSQPVTAGVTPDGARVYVTNINANMVSVINTATNTVVATINVGSGPTGVTVTPDGTRAYVTNAGSNTVSVINTATNAVVATVPVGSLPQLVAVSPDGTRAYVTNGFANTVSVINTATNAVVATIPVGSQPTGVVVTPDGTRAYVTNFQNNTVSVINTATNTVIATLPVGAFPEALGICSNGNALLASGLTFKANTSGALTCTLASGPTGSPGPVFTGGTLQFAGANIASSLPILLQAAGGTFDTNGNNATLAGTISGPGGLTKIGAGTLTLSGSNTYTGATSVNAGTLQAGVVNAFSPFTAFTVASGATLDLNSFNQTIGSLAGAGSVTLGSAMLTTGNDNTSTTFSGTVSGAGGLTKIGLGTLILSGTNSYSGATTVNAGALVVKGSIASSAVAVNNGAMLAGTGTVGATTINSGGTLAPGPIGTPGTMTVAGNLAFQSGALYLVQIDPSTASSANVSGTATLTGASVQTAFAPGSYVTRQYTILHSGGLIGTFTGVSGNVPAGFSETLSYTGTDVILNLTANLGALGCFTINQCNVASAINAFFNNGGALPPNFLALFGLTGANLANALTLLSGEPATGAQQPAFQLMNQFLGIMLDPFVDGRAGVGGVYGGALPFAPDREPLPEDIALAYAKVLRTPVYKALPFEQRWSVWGAGYGGYNRTSGDPVVVGSHDLSARTAGGAAGMDYRVAPGTIVGFALAGGGTGWSLAQGLGSGGSDAFQAGVYATTRSGPFYVAGALAYTQHWMSTDRFAAFGDRLQARFNAESVGGRAEAGYRIPNAVAAITPYAAVQAQNFHTPTYSETDITGGGFGLTYAARNATDTRSELGARFDRPFLLNWNAVLALRGKVAWAHDWISDPSLMPVFEALPGASFIVNGATPAKNSALTSAGAELRLVNGVSLLGKFAGELAAHSQTYAGTGTVRYTW
jgi:YVTN family beta-propeller protein/autotransporter-associated beta strand protein